ncbi:ribonuclease Z [Ilumatobacter sp.]|uniref:ribonuclease Z n=1 Tax=Ilumatobacter sp. TaxID=1967498 RepID=UPI003B525D25
MSEPTASRELVVLGTASQTPTRHRNHNGYLLRWDGSGILFDPGEGIQRQFTRADVSPADVDRICLTHFHGDHCLGLPGMLLRIALDQGPVPVVVHYPASGQEWFDRLRSASAGQEHVEVDPRPIDADGVIHVEEAFEITAARLAHRIDAFGYRLAEPDGRRMLPERLSARGIDGPDVGLLIERGEITLDGVTTVLAEVSEHRRGQSFAFVMDTAWCEAAVELASGVDLLVCESTFLERDTDRAARWGHLTARQAGRLAHEAGARRLVLTHFSRRYDDVEAFAEEARLEFDDVVIANDLDRIAVPARTT